MNLSSSTSNQYGFLSLGERPTLKKESINMSFKLASVVKKSHEHLFKIKNFLDNSFPGHESDFKVAN